MYTKYTRHTILYIGEACVHDQRHLTREDCQVCGDFPDVVKPIEFAKARFSQLLNPQIGRQQVSDMQVIVCKYGLGAIINGVYREQRFLITKRRHTTTGIGYTQCSRLSITHTSHTRHHTGYRLPLVNLLALPCILGLAQW